MGARILTQRTNLAEPQEILLGLVAVDTGRGGVLRDGDGLGGREPVEHGSRPRGGLGQRPAELAHRGLEVGDEGLARALEPGGEITATPGGRSDLAVVGQRIGGEGDLGRGEAVGSRPRRASTARASRRASRPLAAG